MTRAQRGGGGGDDAADDRRAAGSAVMTNPVWSTLLVRAWRDPDGLKVRFVSADADGAAVETTHDDAVRRFDRWLAQACGNPPARQTRTHCGDGPTADTHTPGPYRPDGDAEFDRFSEG